MSESMKLFNSTKNLYISDYIEPAVTFSQRAKGLLGRTKLNKDHCLWIHKCNSVHTFFMKFNIDVLYVDKNLNVTQIHRNIHPWRLSWGGLSSDSCFEFFGSTLNSEIEIGDSLRVSS